MNRPTIAQEDLIVDYNRGKPIFKKNSTIEKQDINEQNDYQLYHNLYIPVEKQHLVAANAPVKYDVPVYGYEYVDAEQECNPCCGCNDTVDVYSETNLYGWGNYKPLPVKENKVHKFDDVLNALN